MNFVISQRTIKDLKAPQTGNRIIYDSQLGGFGVRITAGGAISFILTYWVNGRQRRFTIGRHPELTATAARAEAVQLREVIRRGGDPLAEKQQRYASPTVADLAHDYLERHAKIHKRVAVADDDAGMLRNIILPKLGKLKVAGVERRDGRRRFRMGIRKPVVHRCPADFGGEPGEQATMFFFDPSGNRNEVFAGGYIYYPDTPPMTWYDETLGPGIFYHDRQLNEAFLSVYT